MLLALFAAVSNNLAPAAPLMRHLGRLERARAAHSKAYRLHFRKPEAIPGNYSRSMRNRHVLQLLRNRESYWVNFHVFKLLCKVPQDKRSRVSKSQNMMLNAFSSRVVDACALNGLYHFGEEAEVFSGVWAIESPELGGHEREDGAHHVRENLHPDPESLERVAVDCSIRSTWRFKEGPAS